MVKLGIYKGIHGQTEYLQNQIRNIQSDAILSPSLMIKLEICKVIDSQTGHLQGDSESNRKYRE